MLEFDHGLLRYALGNLRDGALDLSRIGRIDLPAEALERGVPTDPAQMAGLIRELCQENQLYANQVSVLLPPDAALMRVVELPADLSIDQAREQVLDPAVGLQLPIPLIQTDFDLVRCDLPLRRTSDQQLLRRYLLVAVPRELTAKVLSTMERADLNLQRLEVAPLASLRLKRHQLRALARAEVHLWLELLPGRSVCTLVAASGPVVQKTVVAIRDFPEPELDADQSELCISEGLTGEDITVRDARYLPLSALDLRVLTAEIKTFLEQALAELPGGHCSKIWISGINSAHPLLEELLAEQINLEVQRIDPLAEPALDKVSYAQLLLCAGLSRLLGLALGLLPQQDDGLGKPDDSLWEITSDQTILAGSEIETNQLADMPAPSEERAAEVVALPETTSLIAEKVDSLQTSESESKVIQQGALETDLNGAEDSEIEQDGKNDDASQPTIDVSDELPDLVFSFDSDDADVPTANKSLESDLLSDNEQDNVTEEAPLDFVGEEHETWPSIHDLPNKSGTKSDKKWPSISPTSAKQSIRSERGTSPQSSSNEASAGPLTNDVPKLEESEDVESSLGELRFNDEM